MLLDYKGTTFTSSLVQDKLGENFSLEGTEFPIVIAMIDASEPDLAPKQGVQMQVKYAEFDPQSLEDRLEIMEHIETHTCTEEDLSKFYSVKESDQITYDVLRQ